MAHIEQNGAKYIARVHKRGFPTRSKTFTSKREAERWARDYEAQLDKGIVPAKTRKGTTIGDIFQLYLDNHEIDWREKGRYIQIQEDLKSFSLETLTRARIIKYIEALKKTPVPDRRKPENRTSLTAHRHKLYNGAEIKTYSDSTIRKYYFCLKRVLKWHSLHEGYHFDEQRFKDIEPPPAWKEDREERMPSKSEKEKAIYLACTLMPSNQDAWANLIGFAVETAMRAQEIVKAKWSEFSQDQRVLHIPKKNTKTKTERDVLISKRARDILARQKNDSDYVFPEFNQDSRTMTKAFRLLCYKAGVENFKFHDLRHEAISRICENNHTNRMSQMEIMKMTGHKTMTTFARYTKFFNSDKADLL